MNEKNLVVNDFRVATTEGGVLRTSCSIQNDGVAVDMWFEVSGFPKDSTIESADAFFAPCLLLGLKHNLPIIFDVPVSECIAHQRADLIYIFGTQLGFNPRLKVKVSEPIAIDRKVTGAITGFSAGVDSWFSLKENLIECQLHTKKLTHLLVSDVGANTTEEKQQQVLAQARDVAAEFRLGLVSLKSNMADVLKMNFQRTHTARNASVAHLLTSIANTYYYSSADTYDYAGVFPTDDMAYADTIILPLLSTVSMTLRSTGSAFTRAEKTREILSIPGIGERLDVCVAHNHKGEKINCGACWKCSRTLLTLEAFQALDQFEHAFDLDAYGKKRSQRISEFSASKKPTEREAFKLASEAGLTGPILLHQAQSVGVRAAKRLKRSLKVLL